MQDKGLLWHNEKRLPTLNRTGNIPLVNAPLITRVVTMSLMPNLPRHEAKLVLVVDETPLFGRGVLDVIRTDPAYRKVEYACTLNDALLAWGRTRFDVVLVSATLPEEGALKLIETMKEMSPSVKILVMTVSGEATLMQAAFALGADGYVLKQLTPTGLLMHLSDMLSGRLIVDKRLTDVLHQSLHHEEAQTSPLAMLTSREKSVLKGLMQGLTNKGIARVLGTTEGTIKAHVKHLLLKLNCRSRVDMAVWASQHKAELDTVPFEAPQ